jgi:hypothetical protein
VRLGVFWVLREAFVLIGNHQQSNATRNLLQHHPVSLRMTLSVIFLAFFIASSVRKSQPVSWALVVLSLVRNGKGFNHVCVMKMCVLRVHLGISRALAVLRT